MQQSVYPPGQNYSRIPAVHKPQGGTSSNFKSFIIFTPYGLHIVVPELPLRTAIACKYKKRSVKQILL